MHRACLCGLPYSVLLGHRRSDTGNCCPLTAGDRPRFASTCETWLKICPDLQVPRRAVAAPSV